MYIMPHVWVGKVRVAGMGVGVGVKYGGGGYGGGMSGMCIPTDRITSPHAPHTPV